MIRELETEEVISTKEKPFFGILRGIFLAKFLVFVVLFCSKKQDAYKDLELGVLISALHSLTVGC